MTHQQAREQLSAFVDRELSGAELAAVEEHLQGCGQCRLEVEELEGAIRALRSLPEPQAPKGFAETLRKTIRTRSKGRFYGVGIQQGGGRWMTFNLIAIVMLIVLICVALVFLAPVPAPPRLSHPDVGSAAPELFEAPPSVPGLGAE